MEPTDFKPLVSFADDPSPSFVNGFEAGIIWQRMQDGESEIEPDTPLHAANEGTLQHMAQVSGYDAEMRPLDGDLSEWMEAKFTRRQTGERHLSLVTQGDKTDE